MTDFPYDIVGFDLDGTLLDTHADLGAAVNHALALAGRPAVPTADSMRSLIGGGGQAHAGARAVRRRRRRQMRNFKPLYAQLLGYYEANIAVHTRLFPGGEAMLDDLASRGRKLAVVTNKFERFARLVLDELGLSPRFYTIIGGDTLGPGRAKPARDQLDEMICARAGQRKGRARPMSATQHTTPRRQSCGPALRRCQLRLQRSAGSTSSARAR